MYFHCFSHCLFYRCHQIKHKVMPLKGISLLIKIQAPSSSKYADLYLSNRSFIIKIQASSLRKFADFIIRKFYINFQTSVYILLKFPSNLCESFILSTALVKLLSLSCEQVPLSFYFICCYTIN